MNKQIRKKSLAIVALACLGLSSCVKDLDRYPTNIATDRTVYSDPVSLKQALAKVYGAYALTGNAGPAGEGDVAGVDEGSSDFLRNFFNLQELPTEEAIVAWSDEGLPDLHNMNWSSSNAFVRGLYYRSIYQIKLATDFLEKTAGSSLEGVRAYRAEARFLRAFQYWILMDLFGNPPFITESLGTGKVFPPQIKRADLFKFVEQELLDCQADLLDARSGEYGRADKAAAWALLSRLYLNAEVYTGSQEYAKAAEYAEKVINAGFQLVPRYANLFLADNHQNNTETILTINYDGLKSQNWGGMAFLVNGSTNGDVQRLLNVRMGIGGGWGGNRATSALADLFSNKAKDTRYLMASQTSEITKVSDFMQGVWVYKFRNVSSAGQAGAHTDFPDTDFPLFRLAEMYLNYAEASVRGHADRTKGLEYINRVRARAYGDTSGNFTTLSLDDILAERGRELYWECLRRTDLIRFGRFTSSSYVWPWKGGVASGQGVAEHFALYPLPVDDVQANSANLKQNPNY